MLTRFLEKARLLTQLDKFVGKGAALTAFLVLSTGAEAKASRIGVVRSQDNARQWSAIAERLESASVNYCIVEAASWQQPTDLDDVSVLLLPNVSTLNQEQVGSLAQWMDQGGKVIVTGPTGSLSQPEIRSQLRSLFGAYWGFPIAAPSTLEPLPTGQQPWLQQNLADTFKGGVVLPAALNSETVAVWAAEGKPPAVVTTRNTTFLGWSWGSDTVASATLDAAWLQAVLRRYQVAAVSPSPPIPCHPVAEPLPEQAVPTTAASSEAGRSMSLQEQEQIEPAHRGAISSAQALEMSQELEDLIGRFQSALLRARAVHYGPNPPLAEVIAFLNRNEKAAPQQTAQKSLTSQQTLEAARSKHQRFLQLIEQRDYQTAKQEWIEARRLLWERYPIEHQGTQPEIRAIWLDRGTIVQSQSESELAQLFDRLAAAGINTVFFETVNASYPIYPSRVAPQQNILTEGWDPLKAAVKLAHERGLELHAWVWMFAAANQRHNVILGQPTNYLGPVLTLHPDWAMSNRRGHVFHSSSKKAFFDPANPEVRAYLLALVEEIATQYDVDGIHLDYIRYPFQNPLVDQTSGYSTVSRNQFRQQTGVDPISLSPVHPLWTQWVQFRTQQVDRAVATISQQLKQLRPDLILSTAVFPMPRTERLSVLQQNWEHWAQQEWIDWVVPMTYALETEELRELAQPLVNDVASSALILPGIRLLNLPEAIAVDQMQLLRDLPTGGYALFAAENLQPHLQTIFSRAGTASSVLPHRQPFQASALRYQSLQQEWSFLLSERQLILEQNELQEWGEQADHLAVVLNRLADQPTQQNLLTAQLALTKFRGQFPLWMKPYSQQQPYQVEVWENRLEGLERLIDYGERTVLRQARVAERSFKN
ncbi:MAG: family 10 glycosylhydrolase [Cyanophyceae cyanobacterium]